MTDPKDWQVAIPIRDIVLSTPSDEASRQVVRNVASAFRELTRQTLIDAAKNAGMSEKDAVQWADKEMSKKVPLFSNIE